MQKNSLFKKIIFANVLVFVSVFLAFTCFTVLKVYRDTNKAARSAADINLRKSVASCLYYFEKSDFIELQRFVSSYTEINSQDEVLIFFSKDNQLITTNNFEYFNGNKEKIKGLLAERTYEGRLGPYVYTMKEVKGDSAVYGYAVYITRLRMSAAIIEQEIILFVFIATTLVLILFFELFFVRKFTGPLKSLMVSFRKNEFKLIKVEKNDIQEIIDLKDSYNFWVSEIDKYQRSLAEKTHWEAYSKISSQVAHDIRSPLAALDATLNKADQLPENHRVMLRHAVNRIRDIANSLLEKNRQQVKTCPASGGGSLEVRLLSTIIDPVITEKRLQFESKPGVDIDFELTKESFGLFAKIEQVEFRRILSNILNNAVEAVDISGSVMLTMAGREDKILVTIKDNGKGIPADVLPRLGRRGETHGKAGGSGLGLYHADTVLKGWGGSLSIKSEFGKGTEVEIKLPRAEVPDWFLSRLAIDAGTAVVVLDDDPNIHRIWTGRFDSLRSEENKVELIHLYAPDEIRSWVAKNPGTARQAVYLLDYELLGHKETGLSLAEELALSPRAALVTSRCEEDHVLQNCLRLNMKLMPKGLAVYMPISITAAEPRSSASSCCVLIDDDALVRMNWTAAARNKGVSLQVFSSPVAFYAAEADLPRDISVYIDYELGNDVNGESVAKDLHAKGFSDLSMATGHGPEKFAHLPWLKVTGKEPPWA